MTLSYGTGGSIGEKITDEVCLDPTGLICAELEFLGVVNQNGLNGLHADGIMGMGPVSNSGKLFLEALS